MLCRLGRSITPLRGWSFVIAVIKTKFSLTSNGVEDRADAGNVTVVPVRNWGKYAC